MNDEDEVPVLTFEQERERSLKRQREADERATAQYRRRHPVPNKFEEFRVGRRKDALRVTDRP